MSWIVLLRSAPIGVLKSRPHTVRLHPVIIVCFQGLLVLSLSHTALLKRDEKSHCLQELR